LAPSLNLGHRKISAERSEGDQARDMRAEARKRRREEIEQESKDERIRAEIGVGDDQEWDDGKWDKETQTEYTGSLLLISLMKITLPVTMIK